MLDVRAICLDVLTQFFSNLAVASEEVFARHAFLAGSTTAGDDVFCIRESFLHVRCCRDCHVFKTALAHFLSHAFGRKYVIETDVACEAHSKSRLNHVAANHAGCADDDEFVVCKCHCIYAFLCYWFSERKGIKI